MRSSSAVSLFLFTVLISQGVGATNKKKLTPVTLQLNFVIGSQHAAFAYGVEEGIFAEEGIDLKLVEGKSSSETIKTVTAGQARFGFVTSEAVASAVSNTFDPIKVIGTYAVITPYGLAARSDLQIKKPTDLKGKRLGNSKTTSARRLIPLYLDAVGLNMDDITEVFLGPKDKEKAEAVNKGNVDAVGDVTENLPRLRGLTKYQLTWFGFSDFLRIPGEGIIVNTKYLQNSDDRDLNCRMIRATTRSYKAAIKEPDKAAADLVRLFKLPDEGEVYKEGWLRTVPLVIARQSLGNPIGFTYKEDWEQSLPLLKKYKLVNQIQPIDKYFTEDYVSCAAQAQ